MLLPIGGVFAAQGEDDLAVLDGKGEVDGLFRRNGQKAQTHLPARFHEDGIAVRHDRHKTAIFEGVVGTGAEQKGHDAGGGTAADGAHLVLPVTVNIKGHFGDAVGGGVRRFCFLRTPCRSKEQHEGGNKGDHFAFHGITPFIHHIQIGY